MNLFGRINESPLSQVSTLFFFADLISVVKNIYKTNTGTFVKQQVKPIGIF